MMKCYNCGHDPGYGGSCDTCGVISEKTAYEPGLKDNHV